MYIYIHILLLLSLLLHHYRGDVAPGHVELRERERGLASRVVELRGVLDGGEPM